MHLICNECFAVVKNKILRGTTQRNVKFPRQLYKGSQERDSKETKIVQLGQIYLCAATHGPRGSYSTFPSCVLDLGKEQKTFPRFEILATDVCKTNTTQLYAYMYAYVLDCWQANVEPLCTPSENDDDLPFVQKMFLKSPFALFLDLGALMEETFKMLQIRVCDHLQDLWQL